MRYSFDVDLICLHMAEVEKEGSSRRTPKSLPINSKVEELKS